MSGLPDYDEALAAALRVVSPIGARERVGLEHAAGRVLADPVLADRDLPPFDRAQMDGYALRASDVGPGRSYPVAAVVAAGSDPRVAVPTGQCVAIATGAALPGDVDTVIQHELSDRADPVRFSVESIAPGHAVHPRGADASEGDVIVAAGTVLAGHHLAIAASVGAVTLAVVKRPRAVVLTSGDEVVPPASTTVLPHQIRNSNAVLAAELLGRFGAELVATRHVADDPAETTAAVSAALAEADVLITVGGISAGERDFFPATLAQHGVELSLHGAAIQPGRPVLVGRAPGGTVIVGLPGNPVSVLACACLFAWPIVRRLLGLDVSLPWRPVKLAASVRPNARRRVFRPACLVDGDRTRVPRWAGSGDLAHTASTDGLVRLPVQEEEVVEGTTVPFLGWP